MGAGKAVDVLWAIEEIKRLKARYFRCMDTKDWVGFEALFAVDAVFDMRSGRGDGADPDAIRSGAGDIAAFVINVQRRNDHQGVGRLHAERERMRGIALQSGKKIGEQQVAAGQRRKITELLFAGETFRPKDLQQRRAGAMKVTDRDGERVRRIRPRNVAETEEAGHGASHRFFRARATRADGALHQSQQWRRGNRHAGRAWISARDGDANWL